MAFVRLAHFFCRCRAGLVPLWAFPSTKTALHAPLGTSSNRKNALATALLLFATSCLAQSSEGPWLFAGFKNNGQNGVYFAISEDGWHWKLINDGRPVIAPAQTNELMRDPFLQRAPNGGFRMVWTWSWRQPAVAGYSESKDLLHWTPHRQLEVMANEPTALNVWAPALYWDEAKRHWLIFWSSTIPGRFPQSQYDKNGLNHRIYATTTRDFRTFTPAALFFDPGYNVIDATLLPSDGSKANGSYRLVFKDERKEPEGKHIRMASGASMEGPWSDVTPAFTEPGSEGPAGFAMDHGWVVYYDHYQSPGQHYGSTFSRDLEHWREGKDLMEFPAGLRHGSFLKITRKELARLQAYHDGGVQ